jgi:protein tyrosine phosphatase
MIDLAAIRHAIDPEAPATGDIRCPTHDDRHASLSVSVSEAGQLLCHCHAGCGQGDVFAEVRRRAGHLLNGQT